MMELISALLDKMEGSALLICFTLGAIVYYIIHVKAEQEKTKQEEAKKMQEYYRAIQVVFRPPNETRKMLMGSINSSFPLLDDAEQSPIKAWDAQDVSYAPVYESSSPSNYSYSRSKVPWKPLALAAVAVVLALLIANHFFSSPFEDVSRGDYYLGAVKWAYQKRITTGTDKTHFNPNGNCSRKNIVTFLRRAVSAPKSEFDSLPCDEKGCTRGEAIVYLWIVIEKPDYVQVERTSSLRDYYWDAVRWAIQNEITSAQSLEEFSPREPCLRKHAVTFLYNARKLL